MRLAYRVFCFSRREVTAAHEHSRPRGDSCCVANVLEMTRPYRDRYDDGWTLYRILVSKKARLPFELSSVRIFRHRNIIGEDYKPEQDVSRSPDRDEMIFGDSRSRNDYCRRRVEQSLRPVTSRDGERPIFMLVMHMNSYCNRLRPRIQRRAHATRGWRERAKRRAGLDLMFILVLNQKN
ncbi:hypothetical protein EVAR_16841_1 [Eumeta japonica]|uniref:Uncharacterized protein n=1 Tax=Eumeta variegata TaxID=151549 RepID=A0A4C1V1K1_EUMVA|nr:hypothetical protein EVAR_16841_1 [Eumeta japonica]